MGTEGRTVAQGNSESGCAEGPNLVQILSCLVESLVIGLYAALIVGGLSYLSYFYMRSPAGAWTYKFMGLDREVVLTLAAGNLTLQGLAIVWLALLCLIIWRWRKELERTVAG